MKTFFLALVLFLIIPTLAWYYGFPKSEPIQFTVPENDRIGNVNFNTEEVDGYFIPNTKIACFATNEWTKESRKIQCYLIKSDKSKHLLVLHDEPTKSEFDMMKE